MSWVSSPPKVRTVPLKDEEVVHHKQIILARDERAKLDAKTFLTFKRESLSEFPSRFNEVSVTSLSGDELSAVHLSNASAMSHVIADVMERLERFDLLNLFTNFPDLRLGLYSMAWTGRTFNLFTSIDDLDVEHLCKSVKWIKIFIEDDPEWEQDLVWSREILLQACSPELSESIRGEELSLQEEDPAFTGGPITLALICKRLSTLNARALYNMYNHITKLSLKDIEGEDVGKITRQLRGVMRRLESCSHDRFILPPTCYEDILKIFTTSSCENFNAVFKSLQTDAAKGQANLPYASLFGIADDLYGKYQSEWTLSSGADRQSGFVGAPDGVTCHNCGKQGHYQRDCPDADRRDKIGRGGGLGPEWTIPPGREQSGCEKVSSDPNYWMKSIEGTEVHWCGRCNIRSSNSTGRWTNGTNRHFTSQHRGSRRNTPTVAAVVAPIPPTDIDEGSGPAVIPIENTTDDDVLSLATDVHRVSFADALQRSAGN